MKRMLFNATQAEELRVAIVDGQKLIDLDIESANKEQRKSNIYKAVITRVEPSLEACFVDYGTDRHGFLPFKEISRQFLKTSRRGSDGNGNGNGEADGDVRVRVQDQLRDGQELMVQVDKEERGNKGAALTTFISLAGRYLVLMPNNPRGGGVSRRIEGEDRTELREAVAALEVPSGMSVIARTAGIGRIVGRTAMGPELPAAAVACDRGRREAAVRGLSDLSGIQPRHPRDPRLFPTRHRRNPDRHRSDSRTGPAVHGTRHAEQRARVKLYKDDVPLFSRFQIEHQIETAYSRQVTLPSGGAIVIDHTEALVAVDVNSARATKGGDIETTAFNTNLEAADEIARQLRLRDLGGLIVIDFIDMENAKNQREVENRLRDALKYDRARVQLGKISRFGLMELSRQRLRPALAESAYIPCPRCHGIGHIRDTESTALHILRIIQEEAMKDNTAQIVAQMPVDVATFLLNEKRGEVLTVETRFKVNVLLVPNRHLETPNYSVQRMRHDELNQGEPLPASFQMVEQPEDIDALAQKDEAKEPRQEAVVKGITPSQPAPISPPRTTVASGLAVETAHSRTWLSRMLHWFRTPAGSTEAPSATPPAPAAERARDGRAPRPRDGGREGRGRGDGRRESNARRDERRPERERRDARQGDETRRSAEGQGAIESDQRPGSARKDSERREPRREARDGKGPSAARQPRESVRQESREAPRRVPEPRSGGRSHHEASDASDATSTPVLADAGLPAPAAAATGADEQREGGARRRRGRRGRGGERAERTPRAASAERPALAQVEPSAGGDLPLPTDVTAGTKPVPDTSVSQHAEPALPASLIEETVHAGQGEVTSARPRDAATEAPSLGAEMESPVAALTTGAMPGVVERDSVRRILSNGAGADERTSESASSPAVEPAALPTLELPEDSGLVLVETRFASPAIDEPETPPARPRRTRPPRPVIADEPLQIVETRKQESG